ncbi:MAG TPA: cell division protein SepF [Acidimicrobiales bacterium]|nr:cell division protein SepF [Acidimicrobiales bacterium]
MPELVGVAEIAQMVGVSRQRINELVRSDPDFPVPLAELAAGRIWARDDLERWMAARSLTEKGAVVTEIAGATVVQPKVFADAQLVGDTLMGSRPVVIDLRGLDVMLTRRFIDFASGLTYGLRASAERMLDGVLLLEPPDARLDRRQREEIADRL